MSEIESNSAETSAEHGSIDLAAHYQQLKPVYDELASIDAETTLHTSWLQGHEDWYTDEPTAEDTDAWDNGYSLARRANILPDDFDPSGFENRAVYTTNTYSSKEAFSTRHYRPAGDDGDATRDWFEDGTVLPQYNELGAMALIVDIDIGDEFKQRPLPKEHRTVIEQRLELWVQAFATMVGSREEVFVLDSGGGAYVMTPPAALLPITQSFHDDDRRAAVLKEIARRMREVTEQLDRCITEQDDAPRELFSADKITNKNRQFKTLGALHSDFDAVVHPIDPCDIAYDHLTHDDVDSDWIEEMVDWATAFTDAGHTDHVGNLVGYLFSHDFVENDDIDAEPVRDENWYKTLNTWYDKQEKRQEATSNQSTSDRTDWSDVGVTTDWDEIQAATARIDPKPYLKEIATEWATDKRADNTISFDPEWRPSDSGTGAFYDPTKYGGCFTDREENEARGALHAVAVAEGIIESPYDPLEGKKWAKAVDALRDRGEDIPVYLDKKDGKLSDESIVKAGRALDLIDDGDVTTRHGPYGEYETIASNEQWNRVLDALEERDIEHGQEYRMANVGNDSESGDNADDRVEGEVPDVDERAGDTDDGDDDTETSSSITLRTIADAEGALARRFTKPNNPFFPRWLQGVIDIEYPVYEIPDTDYELHLVPHTESGHMVFAVDEETQNVEASEPRDIRDLQSTQVRRHVAGALLEELPVKEAHEDFVRNQLKAKLSKAFQQYASDDLPESACVPSVVYFLKQQTKRVVSVRVVNGEAKYRIIFAPDPRMADDREVTIELPMHVVNEEDIERVRDEYATATAEPLRELDAGGDVLFAYWEDIRERVTETDYKRETLIDEFIDTVNRFSVHALDADDDLRQWHPDQPTAVYIEDYTDADDDVVVVGGMVVSKVFVRENDWDIAPKDVLDEEGILVEHGRARDPLRSRLADLNQDRQERPTVWVVDADRVSLAPPSTEEDDEDADDDTESNATRMQA